MDRLAETAVPAQKLLGVDTIDVVADKGYYKIEDIEACETAGIIPYVPKPNRGTSACLGLFTKADFRYDADTNTYICPAGVHLPKNSRRGKIRSVPLIHYGRRSTCKGCSLRPRCTRSNYRQLTRYMNEDVFERMEKRLMKRPEILACRQESVEHPFGTIKQWMDQGTFLMRRLENVRGEFRLTALAYNIRRAITLIGIPSLIRAVTV